MCRTLSELQSTCKIVWESFFTIEILKELWEQDVPNCQRILISELDNDWSRDGFLAQEIHRHEVWGIVVDPEGLQFVVGDELTVVGDTRVPDGEGDIARLALRVHDQYHGEHEERCCRLIKLIEDHDGDKNCGCNTDGEIPVSSTFMMGVLWGFPGELWSVGNLVEA